MAHLAVYDPALCCSTGVCGQEVDEDLARFAADLDWLSGQGITVRRYNLAQEPGAFTENDIVAVELLRGGPEALPVLLFDGFLVAKGGYPARRQLAQWAEISKEKFPAPSQASSGGSCGSNDAPSGCC